MEDMFDTSKQYLDQKFDQANQNSLQPVNLPAVKPVTLSFL